VSSNEIKNILQNKLQKKRKILESEPNKNYDDFITHSNDYLHQLNKSENFLSKIKEISKKLFNAKNNNNNHNNHNNVSNFENCFNNELSEIISSKLFF